MICLKIRTFVVSATTSVHRSWARKTLWFAWKFVPLWYQQQHVFSVPIADVSCDLLENSYLCGISNNSWWYCEGRAIVVICLKIRTFVVSATTQNQTHTYHFSLWFAWKFVPLWYQQQRDSSFSAVPLVVICLKIRTFVVSATTFNFNLCDKYSCDLLENSYLCGISNNNSSRSTCRGAVVICLKIRTFVVSATTSKASNIVALCCDLLENSYLCGISNNARCEI